jgi:hypothetical protein
MKHDQTVQEPTELLQLPRNKEKQKETQPEAAGVPWQFRALMVIIALGVLMIIVRTFGLF